VKNKTHQWIAITVVASIAVLAAGWFLLISPKRAQVSSLKSDAVSAEAQNSQLQTKLAVLRSQQKGVAAENAALAKLADKIPTTPDLPGLLRKLTASATTANVDLTSLQPGLPTAMASAPGISSITIAMVVTGKYFDVEQYLSGLETLDRGLLVTGITMAPTAQPSQVGASPGLTANISMIAFTGNLSSAGAADAASHTSTSG
jgi:type IV pilus assembly protein PilO